MNTMLFVRINQRLRTGASLPKSVIRINGRKYSVPAVSENVTRKPKYPPIEDFSYPAKQRRIRAEWAMEVQRVKTVEEKMLKINMPRYYGWRSTMINEGIVPYNCMEQMQFYTRTHLVDEPGLPSYYDNVMTSEELKVAVENLKESIQDGLVFEYSGRKWKDELEASMRELTERERPEHEKNFTSKIVCKQVHRSLMTRLGTSKPHLLETEIDHDPRIEAFWFVGGIPPPTAVSKWRAEAHIPKTRHNDPVDRGFQYLGKPNFQLRHHLPLPAIIPMSESENDSFTIPQFKYEPRVTGLRTERRHATNIPGFWPGDKSEFGFVSYHSSGYLSSRNKEFKDESECVKVQAMLGSWGWLLSQACNLGFSTFNDVTYPLTNQMIITNGKWWSFCVYQLNTTLVHSEYSEKNPRRNICWMTEPMKLFEHIEDDKIHGFNDQVLANLVKFYANVPQHRDDVKNLKPYLRGEKYVANVGGDHRRNWLENTFKHIASNRPRHRRLPEVYNWQDIYIRRHNRRQMDKKREPWEYGINMWQRKLDDHAPKYIPKAIRYEKNKGQKFEFTYYP